MRAVPVSDHITWVGAVDWNLRDFHGFDTPRGSTYNAYLVRGADKVALIDTVKTAFVPELLSRISEILDPALIDVIVVNHVEPDHNSGLRAVMAACPKARVVASGSGVRGVAEYHDGLVIEAVGAADVIELGGVTLNFLPAPMVHWPDSMFTYCPEDAVLMCNDAYGQHLASEERFADEVGVDLALDELRTYYSYILLPFGAQIAKTLEKVASAGWAPTTVAPSHGVIWRGDAVGRAVAAYEQWGSGELRDKVIVAYSTMWGSTDALALAISDALAEAGLEVEAYDLAVASHSGLMAEMLDSKGLLVGSPTLHHGMLSSVAGFLQSLSGLQPKGRIGSAFGSFGWSSGATKQITDRLTEIGVEVAAEPYTQKFRPTEAELAAAREWAIAFAEKVKALGA